MIVKKIIISCAMLTVLLSIFTIYYKDTIAQENKSMLIDLSESIPLLVLHNEFDGINNPKTIHGFKHTHNFLVAKINQKYHFIHSLSELAPFDNDHDNIIDQSDPIYGHLYIASYNTKKHNFLYQSLSNTSIRAISLSSNNITQNKIMSGEAVVSNHHQKSNIFHLVFSSELFSESEVNKLTL